MNGLAVLKVREVSSALVKGHFLVLACSMYLPTRNRMPPVFMKQWKAMEGNGRQWKVMEAFKPAALTGELRPGPSLPSPWVSGNLKNGGQPEKLLIKVV